MTMADQIAIMNHGRIEQLGAPAELYEHPATAYVAGFLGASNLLAGQVAGADAVRLPDGTVLRVPEERLRGRSGAVAVGVRPEKLRLGANGSGAAGPAGVKVLHGTVAETSYVGVSTQYVLDTPVAQIVAYVQNAAPGAASLAPGAPVSIAFDPDVAFVVEPSLEEGQP